MKCVIGDVTQEKDVQGLVSTVVKEFGELNVRPLVEPLSRETETSQPASQAQTHGFSSRS